MMSFNDNDFDEVRDERESKAFRAIRGCFKGLLYGASALVWILILYTVFTTRESKLFEQMYFTEATEKVAKESEEYRVHQLIITDFMNDQGDIALSSNSSYYAAETGELSIGVRYNKKLTDSGTSDSILYVLKDQDGNEYPAAVMEEDEIGRYRYARVCFTGLNIPLKEKDGQSVLENDNGMVLTLTLYRRSDGALLSTYMKTEGDKVVEVNDCDFIILDTESLSRMADYED